MSYANIIEIFDYHKLFRLSPDLYLILDTEFNIVEATNAYLNATKVKRCNAINRYIFDVFPDDPNDTEATGTKNLRASLERVLQTKKSDTMAVQRYPIKCQEKNDSKFEERYWSPINIPILDDNNNIRYILHRAEDVTEFVNLKKNKEEYGKITNELRAKASEMEFEIYIRAQEIQEINSKLQIANQELEKKSSEMEFLYGKLENILHLKTELFANISHELRTPLTLILGPLAKILDSKNIPPEIFKDLLLINKNANILLKQVNDLLDVAKSEAGKLELHYEEFNLANLLKLNFECFHSLAKDRQIEYLLTCPENLTIEADSDKLQKIILNILSNAFKFVPDNGKITVNLKHMKTSAIITIADNGPGIDTKIKDRIFERFYQGSIGVNRKYSGTGLGLAITKDFVELHNGTVDIEQTPGGGATFIIELPLLAPKNYKVIRQKSKDKIFTTNDLSGRLYELEKNIIIPKRKFASSKAFVLIVEDNEEMNNFISDSLAPHFNVLSAKNGKEGLNLALNHLPDLILTDIMMPQMSGDKLVKEVRKRKELNDIPIIMLSAKADNQLKIQLLTKGAQDFIEKPFSKEELLARVSNYINLKISKDTIKEKVDELTHANDELDAFNHTVSHDLRNPINTIIGFSNLLLTNVNLYQTELEYLHEINKAAKSMNQLIDDLLIFAKTNKSKLKVEMFNLSEMAGSIIKEHQNKITSIELKLKIQENIYVSADQHLMRIVLDNLINNALKYSSKKPVSIIEFGLLPGSKTFYIRDNGVGFSSASLDKLFIPFSRLHSQEEFPGTGIGLATVKRIIERHNGKIWAESKVNNGSTFYISIPKIVKN